jgi:3D (Asp-Asp-Asp) domain-containing protein/peptidoglycan hydrolase CwlO-like protein
MTFSGLWYLPALVRGPSRGVRTLGLAVLIATALVAILARGVSAETAAELEQQAAALRAENAELAAGTRSGLVGLQLIEARLAQTRAELASFRARATVVRNRRRAVYNELTVARAALSATRRGLARRLQSLYEHGEADVLEVILGAGSLRDALEAVETFDLAARQDKELLLKARSASRRLAKLNGVLAGRERELEQLAAVRAAAAAALAQARAERIRTIAAMRTATESNGYRIAGLEERARTLAAVQSVPAPVIVPGAPRIAPGPASSGVRSLTVVATGYALPGHTASGAQVGWGAIAVDPSVIPMGSRLSVPGYGLGVASDTGGAIQGAKIDLWFPRVAEARAWGARVVTITVYSN